MTIREIGSDFESIDGRWLRRRPRENGPPWTRPGERAFYFESGRQALCLVSAILRQQGFRELFLPAHYCESMLQPFLEDEWRVTLVPVRDDWTLDPGPIEKLQSPHRTLVFSMSFFGVAESEEWVTALLEASAQGCRILSDETHRVWSAGLRIADYRVASLRKLLPLPDGAYTVGSLPDRQWPVSASAHVRLEAMEAKDAYLAGANPQAVHRQRFLQAEELLEGQVGPRSMSAHSADLIDRLDLEAIAERRARNHDFLLQHWPAEAGKITTGGAVVPSHCVIRGPRVGALRRHLINHHVYPPVHWPEPPAGWPKPKTWRTEILSLPVDQRYGPEDMVRLVHLGSLFLKEGEIA